MSELKYTARGQKLASLLKERIVFLDGAMGTMIQRYNLAEDDFHKSVPSLEANKRELKGNNDLLNLTRADVIREIHKEYFLAGSDISTSNTFGATSVVQGEYGIDSETVKQINIAGIRLIREAAELANKELISSGKPQREFFAAASLGPMNKSSSMATDVEDASVRAISFDSLRQAYLEQIEVLWECGADLFIIETSFDTLNVKAALHAYLSVCETKTERIPIAVSMTVSDASGRILSGQTIDAFYASIRHANPLFVGLNCSLGAEKMRPYIENFDRIAECGTHCYPNAGLPNPLLKTGYDQDPDTVARNLLPYAREGLLNVIGGCCGTSPQHISAIVRECSKYAPRIPKSKYTGLMLSGLEVFKMEEKDAPFAFVGERTNVMGSPVFRKAIKEGRFLDALAVARNQVANGANIIDVNFDEGMLDGSECMTHFLNLMGSDPEISRIPVMVDSSNWNTLLSGLKCLQGKGVVNSISLKEGVEAFLEKARQIKKFGAAVVVMAFDESGQASDFESRIKMCSRAYKILVEEADFAPEDIIFDPNVLTVGTGMAEHNTYAIDYINAVGELKRLFPKARISGGISNVSFAFRGNNRVREAMHSVFLYHARKAGLDMGIVNAGMLIPYEEIESNLRDIVEDVILNKSENASEKLLAVADSYKNIASTSKDSADEYVSLTWEARLERAFVKGEEDKIADIVAHYIAELKEPLKVIEGPLMDGMRRVGELFGDGKMFLPQVVKSARVMKRAVAELEPMLASTLSSTGAKVVLATVKGDVHDIGKNIVGAVLACNGFNVVDLGVMVDAQKILEASKDAQIVGLSGLITPSLDEMANVISLFEKEGMKIPIMLGGATTSQLHTAVKLAPLYSGTVIRVGDASLSAGVCASLTGSNSDVFKLKVADEQAGLRADYESKIESEKSVTLLPYESAKNLKDKFQPTSKDIKFYGVKTFEVPFVELEELLPWGMYFRAWNVSNNQKEHLESFYKDTRDILKSIASIVKPKVRLGFFEAQRVGEDILLFEKNGDSPIETINTVRSQVVNSAGICASLADYVDSSARDSVALYAATVGSEAEDYIQKFKDSGDTYSQLIAKGICDMLAEALSRWVQVKVFASAMGVCGDCSGAGLVSSGVRAAVGYPSIPDHSQKLKFEKLLQMKDSIGVTLTDSYMMQPASSVCALWVGNSSAKYVNAKIGKDQLESYALRAGVSKEFAERNMGAVLM